jgi:hypothetical protein
MRIEMSQPLIYQELSCRVDMDEVVHMRLEGKMAELFVALDPQFMSHFS